MTFLDTLGKLNRVKKVDDSMRVLLVIAITAKKGITKQYKLSRRMIPFLGVILSSKILTLR